jgi:SAM-dependent methyltransferase
MPVTHPEREEREREFHDRWASETALDEIRFTAAFEHPAALENRYILERAGDLTGLRLLDIGSGLGESSVYFASRGARVTAADLSSGMLATTSALAARHNLTVDTLLIADEQYDFGEEQYDIVYGANVLHHVENRPRFLTAVHACLKQGGRYYFWDPVAYNPAINVYRRLATRVRTEDESPLKTSDLLLFHERFSTVHTRHFWLLTLALFAKYYLIDRKDPNMVRFWKEIYRESPVRLARWFTPLAAIDSLLLRLPLVRWLSWNIVISGTR